MSVKTIGSIAHQQLTSDQTGSIMGVTSKGIFVKTAHRWVIFLSHEKDRGPLTVNVLGEILLLERLTSGGLVNISPGLIHLPDGNILISTAGAPIWQPRRNTSPPLPPDKCYQRLTALTNNIIARGELHGFGRMLPNIIARDSQNVATPIQKPLRQIFKIQAAIRRGELNTMPEMLFPLMGMGSGLTPSGDDFILGLLLSLNRGIDSTKPDDTLAHLNQLVTTAAYQKTTTISANLIECAAAGLADERLTLVIDNALFGYTQSLSKLTNGLLNWGNSSGADALVGMLTACTPQNA